jgi:hypothetical protein
MTTAAQYMTLQVEKWMKKSDYMPVWLRKMVFLLHICSV